MIVMIKLLYRKRDQTAMVFEMFLTLIHSVNLFRINFIFLLKYTSYLKFSIYTKNKKSKRFFSIYSNQFSCVQKKCLENDFLQASEITESFPISFGYIESKLVSFGTGENLFCKKLQKKTVNLQEISCHAYIIITFP